MSGRRKYFGPWARLGLVLTLFSFAIAQPLYDLVGQSPEFFIFRHFRHADFALFAAVVSLVLPAAFWALFELLARVMGRSRTLLYKSSLGLLIACAILPPIGLIEGLSPWIAVLLSAGVSAMLGHLLVEKAGPKKFLLLLSPAVVIFALLLLLRPGIRELWWRGATAQLDVAASSGGAPPVVLLIFDGLPTASLMDATLEVDDARYPAFARLAREGTWYRRATTVSTQTTQAVPSILSGSCPGDRKPPTFGAHPRNLFTLLGGAYDLDVIETVTRLCPPELCSREAIAFRDRFYPLLLDASIVLGHRLLPPAWTDRLPPVDKNWGGFTGDASQGGRPRRSARDVEIGLYREMLARVRPGSEPTLRFAHLVLPHEPFVYLPSGTAYRAGSEPGGSWNAVEADPWIARHGYQRHLLQLGFTDSLLGELLGALDAAGLYDDTLLIVTADHGSSFIPGEPRRQFEDKNVIDIAAVPLLVKLPNQRSGGAHDAAVQTVDVVSIVADAVGIRRPFWSDGRIPPDAPGHQGEQLSCSKIGDRHAVRVSLDDLQAATDRKLALFGAGVDRYLPQVGPRQDIIGASAATAACPPLPGVGIAFENGALFEDIDPDSGFSPAELVGTIYGSGARDLDLAVVVNGTVRATTRPYQLGSGGATFSAIVPEDSLHDGQNEIAILAIGDDPCRLRPLSRATAGALSLLDTRLGAWADPRVQEAGFAKTVRVGGQAMRWTRGRARLDVPVSPDQWSTLRAIRVELGAVGPGGSDVTISLGKNELFNGRVEEAPWSATFPVGEWQRRDTARIVIRSSVHTSETRRYGVGVTGVWLLSEAR